MGDLNKTEVVLYINDLVDGKIHQLQLRFDDLNKDLSSEHKSSAGDKHETSRAMTQLEQEKLSTQLSQFGIQKEIISKLNLSKSDKVQLGSIVKTTQGVFFISIGLGKIEINNNDVYCISASSPIGQLLLNLEVGKSYTFNGKTNTIVEIL